MEKNQSNKKQNEINKTLISDLQILNDFVSDVDNSLDFNRLQSVVDDGELLNRRIIFESVQNDVSPDSDSVKIVNSKHSSMRRIGQKFLNLFRISFTVEFAGVVLINFTIPKVDSEGKFISR